MATFCSRPILIPDLGRNKLVINHLGRLFVTSDAATIIREIEVVHPAAKLVVMASQAQEAEVSISVLFDLLFVMSSVEDITTFFHPGSFENACAHFHGFTLLFLDGRRD
jgi:hypothetical protein